MFHHVRLSFLKTHTAKEPLQGQSLPAFAAPARFSWPRTAANKSARAEKPPSKKGFSCGVRPAAQKADCFWGLLFPGAAHTPAFFQKERCSLQSPLPRSFSKRPSVCLLFPAHGNLLLSFFNTLPRIFPFVNAKEALFHVFLNFLKRTK
ncbi:MAG TPA: hypothetical protein IAA65_05585 [Candidatus Galloscillospira excrementipullorum]|nr:hypothetical protein [Candidatus Galloscillospira excrementipullorum]